MEPLPGPLTVGRLTDWRCSYLIAVAQEYDDLPGDSLKSSARWALWKAFGPIYVESLYESPEEAAVYATVRQVAHNVAAHRRKPQEAR